MKYTWVNDIVTHELAQRIIDLDFYGARDAGETVETMVDNINNYPLAVITWLVEMIEELQA